jgi:putative N6-adenine-specific DNA methylase
VANETVTISLDSSGESLHKRGWREATTEAPINEALAAGMLLMAGWDGSTDLYDPMCGSGTFLIEAAMIALNIAPGIYRS